MPIAKLVFKELGFPNALSEQVNSVPYESNALLHPTAAGQGEYWSYPFIAILNKWPDEPALSFLNGPSEGTFRVGIRFGIITLSKDKREVIPWATTFLTAFHPLMLETKEEASGEVQLHGQETTIFAMTGDNPDGSGLVGFISCFHRVKYDIDSPNYDEKDRTKIMCSVTSSTSPGFGWTSAVDFDDLHDSLGNYLMADQRPLVDHLPLARKPIAAPDGTLFPNQEKHFLGAYPWISLDGSELYVISSHIKKPREDDPSKLGFSKVRATITSIGGRLLTANKTAFKQRIVQSLYHTREREMNFITTGAGRIGPYQWHLNDRSKLDGAFPLTDMEHSSLLFTQVAVPSSLSTGPEFISSEARMAEDFYLPQEIRADKDTFPDGDLHGGWTAYFPMQERYSQQYWDDNKGEPGDRVSITPNVTNTSTDGKTKIEVSRQSQELIHEHVTWFDGPGHFGQEVLKSLLALPPSKLALPHNDWIDANLGALGQAAGFAKGGKLVSLGLAYADAMPAFSLGGFVYNPTTDAEPVRFANLPGAAELFVEPNGSGIRAQIYIKDEALAVTLNSNTPIEGHKWTHVAVTWNGSTGVAQLYQAGKLVDQTTTPVGLVQSVLPAISLGFGADLQAFTGNISGGEINAGDTPVIGLDEVFLTRWSMSEKQIAKAAFVRKPRLPANVLDIAGINFPVPGTDPNKAIIPSDNPITGDTDSLSKIELGRRIFFDTNLSAEDEIDIACATCHQPERAFTDGKTVAIGIAKGIRNTPSINNMVFKSRFSWDGSVRSLEEQVVLPFTNPVEMGQDSFQTVVDLINADQHHYAVLLNQAFDGVATPENIAQALASFVRAQVVGNSKVDQYLAGDVSALDTTEAAGLAVFKNKGRCIACHRLEDDFGSPASSTFLVNTGLLAPTDDTGNGYGEFVVPSLRNVSLTDPYFHDGSVRSLEAVVEIYNQGGAFWAEHVSPVTSRPLGLTETEKAELVAFLKALDSYPVTSE